jgi:hypothetical protein
MYAYCWANGRLGFSQKKIPQGTLPIAKGTGKKWRQGIEAQCRLMYDGKTYMIPSVQDAFLFKEKDTLEALYEFLRNLENLGLKQPTPTKD